MRCTDWISDVCSTDLTPNRPATSVRHTTPLLRSGAFTGLRHKQHHLPWTAGLMRGWRYDVQRQLPIKPLPTSGHHEQPGVVTHAVGHLFVTAHGLMGQPAYAFATQQRDVPRGRGDCPAQA